MDFTIEVERSLQCLTVLSLYSKALLVFSRSLKLFGARRTLLGVPRMCFINSLTAWAPTSLRRPTIEDRLGATPLILQLQIGYEGELKGMVDLLKMKAIVWNDEAWAQIMMRKKFRLI